MSTLQAVSTADIHGYSTGEIARMAGLGKGQVRAFVRDGLLEPRRHGGGAYRFSFTDLVLLRKARELIDQRISGRRVRRALRRLRRQVSPRALGGVRLRAEGRRIVACKGDERWEPETGQQVLDFEGAKPSTGPSAPVPFVRPQAPDPALEEADDWHARALELESENPEAAVEALLRAIGKVPDHAEAHLDLGRILHEHGDPEAAEPHYRRTLKLRPDDMVAAYNLGVALQDLGRHEDAVEIYREALRIDPTCADAHYNLAGIFESQGNELGALKHFKAYRQLTRS